MDRTISLRLPDAMLDAVLRVAAAEDRSPGDILRDAITRDLRRRAAAKTPVRADERLVAPLRALLADDFAFSQSWTELCTRIARKGYALAESGGGLILQSLPDGVRLCKASELGYSYSALLRRFDQPFPGHAHAATLWRVRARA